MSSDLMEDANIEARIKKANQQIRALHHFFSCTDKDRRVKCNIYLMELKAKEMMMRMNVIVANSEIMTIEMMTLEVRQRQIR